MGKFDAVIFDMDGTLISQQLDFAAIRAELGIDSGDDILQAVQAMPAAQRDRANEQLLVHELAAARRADLAPGAGAVVRTIRQAGMKTALLTRNAEQAMGIVLDRFGELEFDLAWSRRWGPIKPQPDGVLAACAELHVASQRAACVGDFRYDIVAANAAGCVSVLLTWGRDVDFSHEADYVIANLTDLPDILGIEA